MASFCSPSDDDDFSRFTIDLDLVGSSCFLAEFKTLDPQTHAEKQRYDYNTVEKWKKALFDVAEISGFELEAYHG